MTYQNIGWYHFTKLMAVIFPMSKTTESGDNILTRPLVSLSVRKCGGPRIIFTFWYRNPSPLEVIFMAWIRRPQRPAGRRLKASHSTWRSWHDSSWEILISVVVSVDWRYQGSSSFLFFCNDTTITMLTLYYILDMNFCGHALISLFLFLFW